LWTESTNLDGGNVKIGSLQARAGRLPAALISCRDSNESGASLINRSELRWFVFFLEASAPLTDRQKNRHEYVRRDSDIHVSLLSKGNKGGQARRRARTLRMQNHAACILPLGAGSCLPRTRHPFAVSGPGGRHRTLFSASPETVRRKPREVHLLRSVDQWQDHWRSARCVILVWCFVFPPSTGEPGMGCTTACC
jgi:hypothetical protein